MGVLITLDKEREVRIRNKAISLVERKYKKPYAEILANAERLTVDEQIYILYAGLKHEDDSLTVEKVEDLVDKYSNLKIVSETIMEASLAAYGTTKEEALKAAKEQENKANPEIAAVG